MTMAPAEEVFEFLIRVHNEFQPLSEKITFDKTQPLHRNTISLYGSIIELTGSIILLLSKKMVTGVPILLRAVLEAYIDLVNLINDRNYGYYLEVSYLKEWIKILDESKNRQNEYLTSISESTSLNDTIIKWQEKINTLESEGYKALKIFEKFTMAGREKEYKSIYNMLCSDSHNNLRALIDRHIEREETDFSIVFYKAYNIEDSAVYVGVNAEILVSATQQIHEFLDSPVKNQIIRYREEFDRLRGDL